MWAVTVTWFAYMGTTLFMHRGKLANSRILNKDNHKSRPR